MTKEEIFNEAKRNREEAQKVDDERINGKKGHNSRSSNVQPSFLQKSNKDQPKLVGGIFFNPIPLEEVNREYNEGGNSLVNNFFTLKKSHQDTSQKKAIKAEDQTNELNEWAIWSQVAIILVYRLTNPFISPEQHFQQVSNKSRVITNKIFNKGWINNESHSFQPKITN